MKSDLALANSKSSSDSLFSSITGSWDDDLIDSVFPLPSCLDLESDIVSCKQNRFTETFSQKHPS